MPKSKTKTSKKSKTKQRLDIDLIRQAASGRWIEILNSLAGIPADLLDGRHHPCPKCGGTDRFRLVDGQAGAVLCNRCFSSRNGDGFSAVQWMIGLDFIAAAARVGEYLGVSAGENGRGSSRSKPAPDYYLTFQNWNQTIAALWCLKKPPVRVRGIEAAGGMLARYRGQYIVVALPVHGQQLDGSKLVGWAIMNTTGGPLPKLSGDGQVEWVAKPKLTYGSSPGILGDIARLRDAAAIWKLEGITDLLAWLSLPDLPDDHAAITNAMGCQERPARWMVELFRDKIAYVLHDADVPGQRGATGWDENGRHRPGWAEEIAAAAKECRNVTLPYPVAETHGKDLRDWIREGGTFTGLRELAAAGTVFKHRGQQSREADDDPFRLARVNLDRYSTQHGGRTLRFWRDRWYVWKGKRYQEIGENELKAKITMSVKMEFDRLNIEQQDKYEARKEAGQVEEGEKLPYAKKVHPALVGSVMNATRGLIVITSDVHLNSWLPDRKQRNYISMANGILDIDAVLADRDEYLQPHSPDWFSMAHLDYAFDHEAKCPQWMAFLHKNLEGDIERINLLQEWAGYLLTPDTGEQAFMILEGEGANGKSVFCAGIEAMLGEDNCSHVSLELFGDRFSKTMTLGKLANICGDVGELDRVAEGQVKAFVSGNTMTFDRKGVDGVTATPTARLMLACNNRPRFNDKSSGIWRRMQIVPWLIQIQKHERIRNMDKAWWWKKTGELPGIFNWALVGLYRLREQGGFTESKLMEEAISDYMMESNPARSFLMEHVEHTSKPEEQLSFLKSSVLYKLYSAWTKDNGYKPLSEKQFGKEVKRLFPSMKKTQRGPRALRAWCYSGIDVVDGAFSAEDIMNGYVTINNKRQGEWDE